MTDQTPEGFSSGEFPPTDALVMTHLPHLSDKSIMFYGAHVGPEVAWKLSERKPEVSYSHERNLVCPHCGARVGASSRVRLQLHHYNKRLWNVWCPSCLSHGPTSEFPDIALKRYCRFNNKQRQEPDIKPDPNCTSCRGGGLLMGTPYDPPEPCHCLDRPCE